MLERISIFLHIYFFICPFFLSFSSKSVTDFSPAITSRVFKFCIHPDSGDICCIRENQDAEIYFFCPSLPCSTKGTLSVQSWFNIPVIAIWPGIVSFAHYLLYPLQKHAYSHILKILPPKNENFQIKNSDIIFIFCSKHRMWVLVRTASLSRN